VAKRPKLNPAQQRVFKALDSHTRRRDTNGAPLYCCDCGANENRKGNIAHSFDCVVSVAVLALAAEPRDEGES